MGNRRKINVTMNPEVWDRVRALADRDRRGYSAQVEYLLELALLGEERRNDLFGDGGLLGKPHPWQQQNREQAVIAKRTLTEE